MTSRSGHKWLAADLVGRIARRHRLIGKSLELGWGYRLAPHPHRQVLARFPDGRLMYLDLGDRTQQQMYCGTFEAAESRLLPLLLGPGGTLVDVGAHVGWFSLLGARVVGESGRVLAFEAYPPNFEVLDASARANALPQLRPTLVAAAERPGRARVGRQAGSDSGSVTAGPGAAEGLVEVDAQPLDLLVPHGFIDLLKIDVEGRELAALTGAGDVLARTAAVLLELNDSALRRNGAEPEHVRFLLSAAGFQRQLLLRDFATRLGFKRGFVNLLAQR